MIKIKIHGIDQNKTHRDTQENSYFRTDHFLVLGVVIFKAELTDDFTHQSWGFYTYKILSSYWP